MSRHPLTPDYADGSKLTVQASNPADARKQAEAKRDGLISKVKKLKEAA